MKNEFPFFAGQYKNEKLARQLVLSPYPVKTNIGGGCLNYCTVLLRKNNVFLDLGGNAGSLLQGQIIYTLLIIMIVIFSWIYDDIGGYWYFLEIIDNSNVEWFNNSDLIVSLLAVLSPIFIAGGVCLSIALATIRDIKKTVPFRFHRQRREVAMFKWNKKRKSITVRYFPWENICAMVGEGVTVTPTGMIGSGTLFIGGNDGNIEGLFWAAMNYNVANNLDGVFQWETIRRYMDYELGDSDIIDNSRLSFQSLINDYCKVRNISVDEFSLSTRVWWEINGTRFGIFWNNYLSRVCREHYKHDAEFEKWSQPIPQAEWVSLSKELNYYNEMLMRNEYAQGRDILSVGDVRAKYTKYGGKIENELMH